jgi:hypothetical protein
MNGRSFGKASSSRLGIGGVPQRTSANSLKAVNFEQTRMLDIFGRVAFRSSEAGIDHEPRPFDVRSISAIWIIQ